MIEREISRENLSPFTQRQSNVSTMFDDLSDEWREWIALTPIERWRESQKLWSTYLTLGGTLDPDPDSDSPFHFPEKPGIGTKNIVRAS